MKLVLLSIDFRDDPVIVNVSGKIVNGSIPWDL
jgi:hypothetical protein